VRVAVDSAVNVTELGAAAVEAGVTIGVLVEVDIGMKRCGAPAGAPTVALARQVHGTRGLRLDGLQGFEGHAVLVADPEERKRRTLEAMNILVGMRKALEAERLPCPVVSGGGTGTYDITGNVPGVDEMQAGTYALMDCHYRKVRPEFECALSVLATVISAADNMVVVDAGLKAVGSDFGPPVVADAPQAKARYIAEEHIPIDNYRAPVGSRVRLIPSHGCTTCNLHRRLWVVRNDVIEAVWPIEGSGCLE
jgi:D-serine deaminase-like pyridoxal phosphate-dependent protein